MATCGVYRIRNTVNGKVYVGESTDVTRRWRQHKHLLPLGEHPARRLQADWTAMGEAAFAFELVLRCPSDKLLEQEARVAATVSADALYNDGVVGTKGTTRGLPKSSTHRLRLSRAGGGTPFFCKNRTTGNLRRFLHTGEAVAAGFSRSKVLTCLYGQTPSHRDHIFYYDPDFVPESQEPSRPKVVVPRVSRAILRIAPTGEVKRYARVSDVTADGFQRTAVTKCLAGAISQSGGFRWAYEDGQPPRTFDEKHKEALKGKQEGRLDDDLPEVGLPEDDDGTDE